MLHGRERAEFEVVKQDARAYEALELLDPAKRAAYVALLGPAAARQRELEQMKYKWRRYLELESREQRRLEETQQGISPKPEREGEAGIQKVSSSECNVSGCCTYY
jgi:hypothetical protein